MTKIRPSLFLVSSMCLLQSAAAFSADEQAPIRVSMLTDSQDERHMDYASPADRFNNPDGQSDSDLSTSDAIAEKRFTEQELESLRKLFTQAETALKKNRDADYFMVAAQLEEYPLYPYLQYRWLKNHLDRERQIKHFLDEHETSRYAGALKRRWLGYLARKGQWETFLEYYTPGSGTALTCRYHYAQYKTGDKAAALEGARKLWTAGRSQPKICDPLFAELKKSGLFNQELFWQRFEAAMNNNKTSLAKYVKSLMTPGDQQTAELWLQLHRDPAQYIPRLLAAPETPWSPQMFAHGIHRLAGRDVYEAIELWDNNKQRFDIETSLADKIEKRLGLKLAYKNESDAYERLGRLNDSDYNAQAWRIRVALFEQNWRGVITAIEELGAENRKLEKWQYWLARAYQETGKPIQADELLSELSTKRDFYGYMAADRLNREYQLRHDPLDVTQQEIDAIKYSKEFLAAHEFMMLGRENDAKQQWWHALRQLDKEDYPAAAKLAQQWQWDEVAIFTIAKVKHWDDVELRFPLSYSDKIHENAALQNLNPVILYGLIRRESAFNKDARSPSGARGLMQIMPRTGMQIAKDLNERWSGKNSLYDPVKNLRYGSYYYQKLLNQFNGNYAIAAAAYNAGPNRVKKWLPDESVAADIWIETIPFNETREYVTNVLVYALIYQQRMDSDELTMADLTRDVQPLIDIASK
jgi:soluble lytic murein transglycosylase